MKKVNPHSALRVLLVAALMMSFGGGRLAAIGDRIGAVLGTPYGDLADSGNSPLVARRSSLGSRVTGDESRISLEAISCDWQNGMAHKMHWPQLPDFGSSGMDVDMSFLFLADDFKCMATGPINDIHIWGSFRDDAQHLPDFITEPNISLETNQVSAGSNGASPAHSTSNRMSGASPAHSTSNRMSGASSLTFEISIFSDIPAEVNSWSMPGELLWSRPSTYLTSLPNLIYSWKQTR